MKISHVKSKPTKVINVVEATYVDGYRLSVIFDDGVTRLIDFEPFLRQAQNPMTTKYLDLRKFKQFEIDWGNLSWNDREMIFPVANLHRGYIEYIPPKPLNTSTARLNGSITKNVEIPMPSLMIRRLKARAKKEEIPLELLVQRYIEESLGRNMSRAGK